MSHEIVVYPNGMVEVSVSDEVEFDEADSDEVEFDSDPVSEAFDVLEYHFEDHEHGPALLAMLATVRAFHEEADEEVELDD